ncbi:3-hydroxyacyl-CoA dehydrogenase NAD-binding domain-containing protein [Arthrobacter crystallopoietes]|uniref:3-hydroxyacyl-CoA dehydrogenase NAD-binding domain-containing protein n=1 Tax=Crystallibacter crystallopoietes TaxID=37928 RepID=UPI00111149E8|nr:3-hydroxyacyl-CoA dehydrogenase NAD-binding domain-containing protein [Arthrobacter crystallopoietes]QTG81255.1 enoyl-CoA hydratase/isomerase family protein [Arthrobacter crystallopoietes]
MTTPTSGSDVVTSHFEHHGFRFALLTLSGPGGRPATLGPAALEQLGAALDAVELSDVDAVTVTGTGAVFCAGADLNNILEAGTPEESEGIARQGLNVLAKLAAMPVPTFALLNGAALGGGLELALHADYRIAASSVRAFGFPEVRLGLIPGWAGIPLSLSLMGPEATAKLVVHDSLAGRNLTARDAEAAGLVDAVVAESEFLAVALDMATAILAGEKTVPRPQPSQAGWADALRAARRELDSRLHGAAPAPYRALELIDRTVQDAASPESVVRAFGELVLSPEARASIYAFRLTQSLARNPAGRPAVDPRPITSVGVIGAGLMASQLALVFARQLRVPVLMTDLSVEKLDKALDWVDTQLAKQVQRGTLTEDSATQIRGLISLTTDKQDFAPCDAVIEAVFEDLAVKQNVFAELEPILRPDALLLTNTSSLSIAAMGTRLTHPGRLLGFHFFNPVAVLPLLELVRTPQTDPTSLATAFELAARLGKTAVLVADAPGFVVNRLLTRMFSEVLALIDNGGDPAAVDRVLDQLGLPMRPLALLRFIGPVVQQHICETMHSAFPHRFRLSDTLHNIVDAGLPGYLDHDGEVPPEVRALLPAARSVDPAKARSRIIAALADEVTHMLTEDVVAGPEQIDLCMILGANYPFHTGGLTPLLERLAGTTHHPRPVSAGSPSTKDSISA